MTKQVIVDEEEVKLIIYALKLVIIPTDKEKLVWDLIIKLEEEMNK